MKIEWAHHSNLVTKERADRTVNDAKHFGANITPYVPVVRVEVLRAWLIEQRDKAGFYGKHEARGLLDIMLTNLKEQP